MPAMVGFGRKAQIGVLTGSLLIALSGPFAFADAWDGLQFEGNGTSRTMLESGYRRSEPVRSTLDMSYGQSAGAWSIFDQVKAAEGNLPKLNSLLQEKYGSFEGAFSKVAVGFDGIRTGGSGLLKNGYLGVSTEGTGFGVIRNPVVPELHAALLGAGIVTGCFSGSWDAIGLQSRMGLAFGAGLEKRVDAYSTDLLETKPVRSGSFELIGLDFSLARDWRRGDFSYRSKFKFEETAYRTQTPPAALSQDSGNTFFATDWQLREDVVAATHFSALKGPSVGGTVILGPQPLPVDILPRVWSYAQQIYPFPELGAMLGFGGVIEGNFGPSRSYRAVGGLFAGYPGAGVDVNWKRLRANVGTWGIESSAAYRGLGQRIWQGALGLAL